MLFFLLIMLVVSAAFAVGYFMPTGPRPTIYTDPALIIEINRLNRQMSDHITNTKTGLYDSLSDSRNRYSGIIDDVKKSSEVVKL